MQELAFNYYLGLTTVSLIIKETTKVIWDVLSKDFVQPPSTKEWENVEKEYFLRWNLPNCIGALDGKHVVVQAPKNSGSKFFNYKKSHSIVLMGICDAYYRFLLVDIGASGGSHDSIIFEDSGFGRALLRKDKSLGLPGYKFLPKSNIKLPHFLAADAAFPLHENVMRPYPGEKLTREQRVFNYRLSRGRRCIENAFGILSSRWRI